jgi:hypothetical protein
MAEDAPSLVVEQVIQDLSDGRFYFRLSFSTMGGGRSSLVVPREDKAKPKRVVEKLLSRGARLPSSVAEATKLVSATLASGEGLSPEKGSSVTGWSGRTFVLPHGSIGPEVVHFIGEAKAPSRLGTLAAWKTALQEPSRRSSFLKFGIALGWAGPLIELAGEVEGAVFHLTGPSSAGKSLTELAALSGEGLASRNQFLTHDASGRGLEERASQANGRLLVIDELARLGGSPTIQRKRLAEIAHVLTGGQGKVISKAVAKAELRHINFQIVALSSGEAPIEGGPRASARSQGERTRLIEIGVPHGDQGGIFDRLASGESSHRLAEMTELAIMQNHGVAFEHFIAALVDDYAAASRRARKLVANFVLHVEADTPWDRRFARKFGLVYAAAKLGAEYGVAPWSAKSALKPILRIYRNARRRVATAEEAAADLIRRLHKWSLSRRKFPICRKGDSLSGRSAKLLGIRRSVDGEPVLALLRSKFEGIIRPAWHAPEVLRILDRGGILLPGKEPGRYVRQLQVAGLDEHARHDFILFDRGELRQATRTRVIRR